MKRVLALPVVIACLGNASPGVLARDLGYALECKSGTDGQVKILGFLETNKNKTANEIETGSIRLWDEHEWSDTSLLVASYSQAVGANEAQLLSTVQVDLASMEALFMNVLSEESQPVNLRQGTPSI